MLMEGLLGLNTDALIEAHHALAKRIASSVACLQMGGVERAASASLLVKSKLLPAGQYKPTGVMVTTQALELVTAVEAERGAGASLSSPKTTSMPALLKQPVVLAEPETAWDQMAATEPTVSSRL